jgi:hypothetical protein
MNFEALVEDVSAADARERDPPRHLLGETLFVAALGGRVGLGCRLGRGLFVGQVVDVAVRARRRCLGRGGALAARAIRATRAAGAARGPTAHLFVGEQTNEGARLNELLALLGDALSQAHGCAAA